MSGLIEVKTNFQNKLNHILVLKDEVAEIKKLIKPEDCGHMHTTVNFLNYRIDILRHELETGEKVVDYTHPKDAQEFAYQDFIVKQQKETNHGLDRR